MHSTYSLLFVNIIGGGGSSTEIRVDYGDVAISVLIYLGIPLALGIITRFSLLFLTSHTFFHTRFLPFFSPLALLGLLYTILVLFAYQGHHILHNLGPVFRVFVPMVLYFCVMWTAGFALVWRLSRRYSASGTWRYDMAVVQAFTLVSQELAIAVTIAVYGVGSDQALAATIGPLVEVPVLLALTWVALFLRTRLRWPNEDIEEASAEVKEDGERGVTIKEMMPAVCEHTCRSL